MTESPLLIPTGVHVCGADAALILVMNRPTPCNSIVANTSIPHYLVLWCLTVGVVVRYDVGDARSAARVPVVALRGEAVG